jgi:hypothetical protein
MIHHASGVTRGSVLGAVLGSIILFHLDDKSADVTRTTPGRVSGKQVQPKSPSIHR